ncbi:MAG: hypothetical protein ABGX31_07950 [bacterium]
MSLIRVRRNRKKNWIDHKKGMAPRKLGFLLIVLVAAIWYLSVRF